MILLAVDPSIRSAGAALFADNVLITCARLQREGIEPGVGVKAVNMAGDIARWVAKHAWASVADTLVAEWPQIYAVGKSKGDPNDLPGLAAVIGALAGMLRPATLLTPTPREWAGQLPKVTKGDPWASPRAERVASRLSAKERALVPKSHDAIDAVALGLWALGRFDRVRVFPGAGV